MVSYKKKISTGAIATIMMTTSPLLGQKTSRPIISKEMKLLESKILELDTISQPRRRGEYASELAQLSTDSHNLSYLLYATRVKYQAEQEIEDTLSHTINYLNSLEKIVQFPWLTSSDRVLAHIYIARVYGMLGEEAWWRNYYRESSSLLTTPEQDLSTLASWTRTDYKQKVLVHLNKAIGQTESLAQPFIQPLGDELFDKDQYQYRGASLGWVLCREATLLHRAWSDQEEQKAWMKQYVLPLVDRLLRNPKLSAQEKLQFEGLRYLPLSDGREEEYAPIRQDVQGYRDLLNRYQSAKIIGSYILPLARYYVSIGENKTASDILTYWLDNRNVRLAKSDREELVQLKRDILTPQIHISIPRTIIGHREQRLILETALVKEAEVECWKLPSSMLYLAERDMPSLSQLGKPFLKKRIHFTQSPQYIETSDTVSITLPEAGTYIMRVTPKKSSVAYSWDEAPSLIEKFQVTDTYVLELDNSDGQDQLQLFNSLTGAPLSQLEVDLFLADYDLKKGYTYSPKGSLTTNNYGLLTNLGEGKNYYRSRNTSDRVSWDTYVDSRYRSTYNPDLRKSYIRMETDRAIYRPGQRVSLVGYLVEIGYHADDASVLAKRRVDISATDANGNKLYTKVATTDQYGRFSADFTLPQDMKLGQCQFTASYIYDDQRYADHKSFSVAEYKREKFEVGLVPIDKAYYIGDSLTIQGWAKNYYGGALSDARVTYTIRSGNQTQEGEVSSDAQGEFSIPIHLGAYEESDTHSFYSRGRDKTFDVEVRVQNETGESVSDRLSISARAQAPILELRGSYFLNKQIGKSDLTIDQMVSFRDDEEPVVYQLRNGNDAIVLEGTAQLGEELDFGDKLKDLPSGVYRLSAKTEHKHFASELLEQDIVLFDPTDSVVRGDLKYPLLAQRANQEYTKTEPPSLYYCTLLPDSYLYYQINYDNNERVFGELRPKEKTLNRLELPLPKDYMPEHMSVKIYSVRYGRLYEENFEYSRKQPNKEIDIEILSLRDKTNPGAKEQLSFRLTHQGKPVSAGITAWMYDASLEALQNYWRGNFNLRIDSHLPWTSLSPVYEDYTLKLPSLWANLREEQGDTLSYDDKADIVFPEEFRVLGASEVGSASTKQKLKMESSVQDSPAPRKNFAETAFFLPNLQTDATGKVSWEYTIPESLTRWKLLLIANTKDMNSLDWEKTIEVSKQLMVQANLPRFVREGDKVSIGTTVQNSTDNRLKGKAIAEFFNPQNLQSLKREEIELDIEPKGKTSIQFSLPQISGLDSLGIRVLAQSAGVSDGEEYRIPVLSREQTQVVSQAFTINQQGEHQIRLDRLFPSNGYLPQKGTIDLSVESNPLFLALQTLPVLQTTDSKDAISLASAIYAQRLTASVVERMGDLSSWIEARRQEIHRDIRSDRDRLLLEPLSKTPWQEAIRSENELVRTNALLDYLSQTDLLQGEEELLHKLQNLQNPTGAWSWYPKMPDSEYITYYIMRLFLRLESISGKKLSEAYNQMLRNGWTALTRMLAKEMTEAKKMKLDDGYISSRAIEYLYLLELNPKYKTPENEEIRRFYSERLRKLAHTQPLYLKPMIAIALRSQDRALADQLLESLVQHLSYTDEGAFFAQMDSSPYWWTNRTYTMTTEAIEAFVQIAPERYAKTIQSLQQWLLSQKRAVRWESTTATAEAVYALMLGRSQSELSRVNQSELTLLDAQGGKQSISGERIATEIPFTTKTTPKTLEVTTKTDGQVWGSATARYTLPTSEVTAQGKELQVQRQYYLVQVKDGREVIVPLQEGQVLKVGDVILTQMNIQLERDMNFVALLDPRLGFAEPLNQISGYTVGGGTYYYVEPRDQATHFYFDKLSRGAYTLQYRQKVVRSGSYEAPAVQLQSVYAPEYTANSRYGGTLEVR